MVLQAVRYGLIKLLGAQTGVWVPGAGEIIVDIDRRNKISSISANAPSILGRSQAHLKNTSIFRLVAPQDRDRLAEVLNYVRRAEQNDKRARDRSRSIVRRVDINFMPEEGVRLAGSVRAQGLPAGRVRILVHELGPTPDKGKPSVDVEAISQLHTDNLADLSHEMKTPLNAILGFSDAMREETFGPVGNDRYREYADHIYSSGEHLMGLVTSILESARSEAPGHSAKPTLGNISDVARECAEMVRKQSDAAGLSLNLELEDIDDSVFDSQAVRQILINLMTNAVKFTKHGSVIVSSRLINDGNNTGQDMSRAEIIVRDTGIGMSAEQLDQLGKRFTEASKDGVRGTAGNGLGLMLAVSLARAHGGDLSLETAPGVGTIATLTMPFVKAPSSTHVPLGRDQSLGPQAVNNGALGNLVNQAGPPMALQTQLERIDDYREKLAKKQDVSAA